MFEAREKELRDRVSLAVNSLEAGVETKKDTVDSLCDWINSKFIHKDSIENLSIKVIEELNNSCGITLDVRAGEVKDIEVQR